MGDLVDRDDVLKTLRKMFQNNKQVEEAIKNIKPKIKSESYVKLLPCTCGARKRRKWFNGGMVSLECRVCGKKSLQGKTEAEAHVLWNEMIEAETKSQAF